MSQDWNCPHRLRMTWGHQSRHTSSLRNPLRFHGRSASTWSAGTCTSWASTIAKRIMATVSAAKSLQNPGRYSEAGASRWPRPFSKWATIFPSPLSREASLLCLIPPILPSRPMPVFTLPQTTAKSSTTVTLPQQIGPPPPQLSTGSSCFSTDSGGRFRASTTSASAIRDTEHPLSR